MHYHKSWCCYKIYWRGGEILDPELAYTRALALQLVNSDFDFKQILSYKLAPFPPSLFEKENVLRTVKLSSNLIKTLKVESNEKLSASNLTATFLNGFNVFWHGSWSKKELSLNVWKILFHTPMRNHWFLGCKSHLQIATTLIVPKD